MLFASNYVYEESEESEEEIEEDMMEADGDMDYSDDGNQGGFECDIMDFDEEDEETKVIRHKKGPKGSSMNTLNLELKQLKEKPDKVLREKLMYTCVNRSVCGAVLSHIDTPIDVENSTEKIWRCRFCGVERTIKEWPDFDNGDERNDDILYTRDPDSPPDMTLDPGDLTVVFVLDTSGSMAQPVEPKKSMMSMGGGLMGMGGGMGGIMAMLGGMGPMMRGPPPVSSTAAPGSAGDKTRLEALRDGISNQIKKLKAEAPNTKVGVITFNDDVTILGDGTTEPVDVPEQIVNDYSSLLSAGQRQKPLGTVEKGCDKLVERLGKMKEEGRTALGPAMVVAMAMAGKSKTSKIILCTDGYANVGLGMLEDFRMKETSTFYTDVKGYCKTQGISVSLISFDKCGMAKELGELPVETGGTVCLINPSDTELPIDEELKRKTMGTDAFVKFVVHKQMYIESSNQGNDLQRSNDKHLVGNIHDAMKQVFRFGFRTDEQSKQERKEIKEIKGQLVEKPKAKKQDVNLPDTDKDNTSTDSSPKDQNAADTSSTSVDIPTTDNGDSDDQGDDVDVDKKVTDNAATSTDNAASTTNPVTDGTIPPEQINGSTGTDKKDEELKETPTVTEEFPFQVQIFYIDLNGVEATRIWTNVKPVTADKKQAEEGSNLKTRVENLIQDSATRFLDIQQGKQQDKDLGTEARNVLKEINQVMEQLNEKPELSNFLNQYLVIVNNISSSRDVDEEIAAKLRNFQKGTTVDPDPAAAVPVPVV